MQKNSQLDTPLPYQVISQQWQISLVLEESVLSAHTHTHTVRLSSSMTNPHTTVTNI